MAENIKAETIAKHTTLIFIAVTATTATVTYNSMAVVTAIPPMKAEFDMSLTMTQWIMNGYSLASAVLVAAMGRFGDIFGHMRVIVLGMICFLLGSFTILLAGDTAFAIVGRVLQGIGAAGILSTSLAILNNAVSEAKRAAAIGFWFAQDITATSTFGKIWWPLVLIGTGEGLAYSLLPRAALRVLPEEDAGQGSGVINTYLYFGLTMGVVLGGIVSATSLHTFLSSVVKRLGLALNEESRLVHILVHGTPGQIKAAFDRAAASGPTDLKYAMKAAIGSGFSDVMLLGAAIALIGLVLMAWLLRGQPE